MTRKPTPKPDNPEQFKRFIETAREVGADERPEAIDRAFERVMGRPRKTESPARSGQNRSRRNRDVEDSR